MAQSTPEAWPLIRGRLRPPVHRGQAVLRPRLNTLLDEAKDYEVVILAAPSGYGKTTAVAQWYEGACGAEERACAWVSLDEMDSEAPRVLMYLVGALAAADETLAEALSQLSHDEFEAGVARPLRALLAAVARVSRDIYLVVDDLHGKLDSDALSIFSRLVNHGLPNLHVILILRDAIDLPLARAKMQRSLLEIGPEQLQFSREESEQYFSMHDDVAMNSEQLDLLCDRTDGWVAGLQLALLSLRGRDDVSTFINSFSGEHRDVADLLTEEVLAGLPEEQVVFLEESSVLSSFSAELCDTIFQRSDSAQMIARLEDGNFFIFPMDDERRFYRYHRLFGEHLRRALEKREAGRAAVIHREAARWFADNGLPVRACLHASQAQDETFFAATLEAVAPALREYGYGQTLINYSSQLRDETLDEHPQLGLDCAYVLTLTWRFDRARHLLNRVRAELEERGLREGPLYAELLHREGQLALLRDEHEDAIRYCSEWLAQDISATDFDRSVVRTSIICSNAEFYDFSELEQAVDIRRGFAGEELAWATVWHDSIIGACYLKRAALEPARERFERALKTAEAQLRKRFSTPSMPAMYLAALRYETGDVDGARELLDRYIEMASELGMVGQLAAGYVTRARIERFGGDIDACLGTLDEAEVHAARLGFTRLHHIVVYERLEALLANGFSDRAQQLARAEGVSDRPERLNPSGSTSSATEPQALAYALICLAQNKLSEALELIEKWRKFTSTRGAYLAYCRFTVLGLRAALLKGDSPKASRLLRDLLELHARDGLLRSILDGGRAVVDLLRSTDVEDERYAEARRRLLRAAGERDPVSVAQAAPAAPAEALNARESEILRLVEQGMMNKQIASELGLTIGTVKWYMQQIFSKLGVRRRAQAIHKAKTLGFI